AAALGVGQLPGLAPLARDHPRRRLIFGRLSPLKIDARAITRPAQTGRRITDQLRTAHDAVDGKLEAVWLWRGGPGRRGRPEGLPYRCSADLQVRLQVSRRKRDDEGERAFRKTRTDIHGQFLAGETSYTI